MGVLITTKELNNEECMYNQVCFSAFFLLLKKKGHWSFGRIYVPGVPYNNSLPILAIGTSGREGKGTHTNVQILKPFHTCKTFKCHTYHIGPYSSTTKGDIHSITNNSINTRGPCNVNFNQ